MFKGLLCHHCMIMMPHFERYAEGLKDKIILARIDVARNSFAASRYGIMATPSFKYSFGWRTSQEIVGKIYPTLLRKINKEALDYSNDRGSRSAPIDYNTGYI